MRTDAFASVKAANVLAQHVTASIEASHGAGGSKLTDGVASRLPPPARLLHSTALVHVGGWVQQRTAALAQHNVRLVSALVSRQVWATATPIA